MVVNATRPYSNSACELTRALVKYYIYTYLFILHIDVIGGVISIRDPYICAVHEFVPTNRTLSSTGPLSVQ